MRKYLNSFLLIIVFILLTQNGWAQYFMGRNSWKKQRSEIIMGIGVSNFLGDLGGRDAIGTHYSPVDLETSLTRPTGFLGYRYRFTKNFALRLEGNYLRIWGDDKLTQEKFRNNRNLNFRSDIFEGAINVEVAINSEKKGNRYHLAHTFKRRQKGRSGYTYFFVGIGGFYFNPKAKYQGSWVALQPLGTEGQGIIAGKHKYSRFAVCIPMGIGFKGTLSKQWAYGLEFNFRKTFTDYIDDVSGTYVDNNTLAAARGPVAAALADPNLGNFPIQLDQTGKSKGGMQRGDTRDKDSYMSMSVTIGYYLKTKKTKKKTRSKF